MTMKEARQLTPGTVLAVRILLDGRLRKVVTQVKVLGPRRIGIQCTDGATYDPKECELPTREDTLRWERRRAEDEAQAVFDAEVAQVCEFFNVPPSIRYHGFHAKRDYSVTLSREQALALIRRVSQAATDAAKPQE